MQNLTKEYRDYISTNAARGDCAIADVANSKCPLLFTVQCNCVCAVTKFFTRKNLLPTSVGNAQAQLHFRDDQQRAFGISNISYPIYFHGKAYLSKRRPWCVATESCRAQQRSQVRFPSPHTFFSPPTHPSFIHSLGDNLLHTFSTAMPDLSLIQMEGGRRKMQWPENLGEKTELNSMVLYKCQFIWGGSRGTCSMLLLVA